MKCSNGTFASPRCGGVQLRRRQQRPIATIRLQVSRHLLQKGLRALRHDAVQLRGKALLPARFARAVRKPRPVAGVISSRRFDADVAVGGDERRLLPRAKRLRLAAALGAAPSQRTPRKTHQTHRHTMKSAQHTSTRSHRSIKPARN